MHSQQDTDHLDVSNTYSLLPSTESHVKLHLLDGGSFIATTNVLHANVKNESFRMHDWAFHIFHPSNGRHLLWDVGLSNDKKDYPPWTGTNLIDVLKPTNPKHSLVEQLLQSGVGENEISTVIFSHAHWDHCRPIATTFPKAVGLFGPSTIQSCSPGHLRDRNSQWDGRFFDPELKTENCEELSGPWQRFGPFDRAMDFFGDGSFWVIQAPGHMKGNLCAAARLQCGEWVLLASDCCHTRELLLGDNQIAVWCDADGAERSLHENLPAAEDTLSRLRIAEQKLGMHIALAHDASWITEGSDKILMSLVNKETIASTKE